MGHLILKDSLTSQLNPRPMMLQSRSKYILSPKMMTDNTEMEAGSLFSYSSPACLPSSLPT